MSQVTRILQQIDAGDPVAAEELLPLVYDELRKLAKARMANEKPGQTLQATALVHDAYLRLVDTSTEQNWNSRGHFFAAAAEAMRRILVERARQKSRLKRGGGRERVDLLESDLSIDLPPERILAVDETLQKLAVEDNMGAEIVKFRFFAGLSVEEAAAALGISRATGFRHWRHKNGRVFARSAAV